MKPKDIALAPIYLYQARKLKRTALTLPEAEGDRYGVVSFDNQIDANLQPLKRSPHNKSPLDTTPLTKQPPLHLMITGDSSAAGVGVNHQEEALVGHLLTALQNLPAITQNFSQIEWSLHATSGHTSFDILRRLYVVPQMETDVDVMIVLAGVNDTTANVSPQKWQSQLEEIITLSKRKFGAKHIIFPYLPPMAHMPSIPSPLSSFVGAKSDLMNKKLQEVSDRNEAVTTCQVDFSEMGCTAEELFSEDGFHPNTLAYEFWAHKMADHLINVMDIQ